MRRGCSILVLAAVGVRVARGDDTPEVHARWQKPEHGPWLTLEPALQPKVQGLGATEETEGTQLRIGARTSLVLEGSTWLNKDTVKKPLLDLPGRGWQAALRLSHDFGWFRVGAAASLNHVDSRYERGTYRDVRVSVSRTTRLSRWMTAWISLEAGSRHWYGEKPPDGEADGTEAMLSIGTTFR